MLHCYHYERTGTESKHGTCCFCGDEVDVKLIEVQSAPGHGKSETVAGGLPKMWDWPKPATCPKREQPARLSVD